MTLAVRPDFFRSPAGNVWTVMCFYNEARMAGLYWPEPDENGDIAPEFNTWRCRVMMTQIKRGRAAPSDANNDSVALVRVSEDSDGFPRLLLASLPVSALDNWEPSTKTLDDPATRKRNYEIDGERARIEKMTATYAIMRWCSDFPDFPRREWTFPLWRWELGLAALKPVSFEMMGETFNASEHEL